MFELRARAVQRVVGAGHVADDEVERRVHPVGNAQPAVHPHRSRCHRGRSELGEVLQGFGGNRGEVVLGGSHRIPHPLQPVHGVGFVRREIGEEGGDPVLVAVLLTPCADADRDHGDEWRLRQAVVEQEIATQRARAERHHDIVERAAELPADSLRVVERNGDRGEAAVWCDRAVPRGPWRARRWQRRWVIDVVVDPAQSLAQDPAESAGHWLGDDVGECAEPAVLGGGCQLADAAHGQAHHLLGAPQVLARRDAQHVFVGGDRVGDPWLKHAGGPEIRAGVQDCREHRGAGRAIDRGMVHLGQLRDAGAVGDALDHVQLPQGTAAVQRPGDDPADHFGELFRRAGCGHGVVADVEVDVERGIFDPVWHVESEGHFHQTAAERCEQMHALEDDLFGRFQPRAARRVRRVVDVQRRDMAEDAGSLHVQEADVDSAQLPHARSIDPPVAAVRRLDPSLWHAC